MSRYIDFSPLMLLDTDIKVKEPWVTVKDPENAFFNDLSVEDAAQWSKSFLIQIYQVIDKC